MSRTVGEAEPDAAGFVLAGGRSSRMGEDKSLVLLERRPLVEHALSILRQAGLTASIAGARAPLAAFAPVVEDAEPDLGPLGGICAALASTQAQWSVFLPVDLPLLPSSLIAFLLAHARITDRVVTVPSFNGFAQTFPAVVDRAALPPLLREFKAGRGGCFSGFLAAAASLGQSVVVIAVEPVVQSGHVVHPDSLPAAHWFININTPADLHRAEAHIRPQIA